MRQESSTGRIVHSQRAAKPRTGLGKGQSADGRSEGSGKAEAARVRLPWLPLLVFALLASALPAFAAPTVWLEKSLIRVGPTDAAGSGTTLDLYVAKGETRSFQIVVQAPTSGPLTNVNVTAPGLGGAQVTLYREYYVYLPTGSPNYASNQNPPGGPGWYPDGLVPFVNPDTGQPLTGATITGAPFSVAAGENQPVWVDVSAPRTQAAGIYTGTFTVTSDQGNTSVTLNLHVWNFTLPVKPAENSCFLIWNNAQSVQWEKLLLQNRIMPETDNLSYESSLISQYGLGVTSLPFWSAADASSGTIDPAPSVQQFQQAAAVHEPGLLEYDYMADEIGGDTALYPTIKQWAYNMHQAGVDNLITMAPDPLLYDDGSGTGRSAVDIWVMLPKEYDQEPNQVNYVISKGDQAWSYNCLQQDDYSPKWLLDMAPVNYRLQPGFINQSLGLTGLLYWRVDWWTSDPWNNPYAWSSYPGEGMLVYPGDQVGLPGDIVPSMRLKYVRDGIDDYDYVQLLKQAGLGDFALQVARSVGPDWTNWTRDPNAVEAARVQLGTTLDSLGGGNTSTETVTATASAAPTTVASSGTAYLTATAVDSLGHTIASWSWSDGGAGGAFSPSATAQNPTYTAPTNTSGANKMVTLTVTATSSGTTPVPGTASASLTVQSAATTTTAGHTVTPTVSASSSTVASGGVVTLTGTAVDSQGHTGLSWQWSDGGAGGTFSSATAQSPTYTAPSNTSGSPKTVTLTATVTCKWYYPWVTGTASTSITVNSASSTTTTGSGHTVTVTASASLTTVASGASTVLTASAVDSQGHTGLAWQWSDGGAGGTFSSATAQSPTYTAPTNTSGSPKTVTLTATATCKWYYPWVTGTASVQLTVNSTSTVAHTLSATAAASPTTVSSGGTTVLTASAVDSQGHTGLTWQWSDGGAGGAFSPSASAQNPSYTAPVNTSGASRTVTLTATVTCAYYSTPISASATVPVTVTSVLQTLSVTAAASPTTVPSATATTLTASAVDSLGYSVASWVWSDGGAGGTFSPSASTQNPTYTPAANTSGATKTITLTVTATSGGSPAVAASATVNVAEQSVLATSTHTVTATVLASPTAVASGGSTALTAKAVDSQGHTGLAWQWSDGGAGGTFSPSATVQNPTYTAPANTSGSPKTITLTVKAICEWYYPWVTGSASVQLTVNTTSTTTSGHTLSVTAAAAASTVAPGGSVALKATPVDSQGHTGEAWQWTDHGAGGTFLPSATSQNPTYVAPSTSQAVTLTVTSTCEWYWPWITAAANVPLTVQ